ncbi:hypothetical protein GLAREA_07066 [Glarea lozoyensis ATCC 20868]|uniref:Uncharacterized protein n=1 Tax=Glarea lozoyensis (strain ATCC 20868 / MF5171) TaxID=1116229 RepID=S3E6P4_GLAL2|nr:uncharacterized protein GLAREA_07066 [Glarea lozoyensis ATCC 20868]EPE34053.1 hypothetical protein GLAREA_07066 [Glarea lozoyensis ATCC 20868]
MAGYGNGESIVEEERRFDARGSELAEVWDGKARGNKLTLAVEFFLSEVGVRMTGPVKPSAQARFLPGSGQGQQARGHGPETVDTSARADTEGKIYCRKALKCRFGCRMP